MPRVKTETPPQDTPAKRAMARARRKANRRRAWPRWAPLAIRLSVGLSALMVSGGFGIWLWQTGHMARAAEVVASGTLELTADAGFKVREVLVAGRIASSRTDLVNAARVNVGDPILGIDLARIRSDLEDLPWVRAAAVERRLPDVLFISLTERQPLALWQHENRLSLIDREGTVLTNRNLERFGRMPIVVGGEARVRAAALLDDLATQPSIRDQLDAAIWVGNRRWDLQLKGGIRVRLPEEGVRPALARLADAVKVGGLLDRAVVAIDLRIPDRLVVQTSGGSALAEGNLQARRQ